MFQGLKTGMYYLRTKPAANAIQFLVDKSTVNAGAAVKNGVNGTNRKATNSDSEEHQHEGHGLLLGEQGRLHDVWLIDPFGKYHQISSKNTISVIGAKNTLC
jgi:hypothetical protein